MTTTADNITDTQIWDLACEAGQHGDHEMVEACRAARYADGERRAAARAECARVISDAEAMAD